MKWMRRWNSKQGRIESERVSRCERERSQEGLMSMTRKKKREKGDTKCACVGVCVCVGDEHNDEI